MLDLYEFIRGSVTSTVLTLSVFLLGLACFASALNIFPGGLKFGPLPIPAPSSRKMRAGYWVAGAILLLASLALAVYFVEYKASFKEVSVYQGKDAKQITVDGEDIYILRENGNVLNISSGKTKVIDDHSDTDQIVPAGGLLYFLKQSGQVWTFQPVGGEAAQESSTKLFDDGTHTKQIIAVGEALYVLKESGNVWRYFVLPPGKGNTPNKNKFAPVDPGTATQQIASSGTILYILKQAGDIWQYAPSISKDFQKIYSGRDALEIGADGGVLYFIKNNGTTWKIKDRGLPVLIRESKNAKSLVVQNGFLYILTGDHKISTYSPESERWRELERAGDNNAKMAAFGPDLFVIKDDKNVFRYSEHILKR